MKPRIETLPEKKLAGKRLRMSFAADRTGELWRSFMAERGKIDNNLTTDLISLQIYGPGFFDPFDPGREFEKWALAEVSDHERIPEGMEAFTLPGGLYAVFLHKGSSSDNGIFQYIFGVWLPGSGYALDERPHFEVLGAKYRNNDPGSEEEIWVPVRLPG